MVRGRRRRIKRFEAQNVSEADATTILQMAIASDIEDNSHSNCWIECLEG